MKAKKSTTGRSVANQNGPETPSQEDLLRIESDHEKHWQGMPEFIQGKKAPYAIISVRFANEEALQDFGKRLGQTVTVKTKTIWHPTFARRVAKPVWKDAKPLLRHERSDHNGDGPCLACKPE